MIREKLEIHLYETQPKLPRRAVAARWSLVVGLVAGSALMWAPAAHAGYWSGKMNVAQSGNGTDWMNGQQTPYTINSNVTVSKDDMTNGMINAPILMAP